MASSSEEAAAAAHMAILAHREELNHESVLAYVTVIGSLAGLFILFHLSRWLGQVLGTDARMFGKPSLPVLVSRTIRRTLNRKIPVLPSAGHAVIVFLYLATNIIITFTNLDPSIAALSNIASRTAWMAVVNLALVIFLALKNTPLAFLTAWSYERLNILHQVSGYATVVFVILHASCYSSYFAMEGRVEMITRLTSVYGIAASLCFLVLAFAATVIRRWWYELFYYMHITFSAAVIVLVGLHQPEFSKKILFITCVAGGIWGLDRLIRLVRVAIYSTNNRATLNALPNGGTRVTMAKAPVGAAGGKHCFLWIPGIRSVEMHPFTIAATGPLEFLVASYDGFTQDLHNYAVQHPGASLAASVEGPYGTIPDARQYNKVVLIAGGSGASFAFGTALDILDKMAAEEDKTVDLIWIVKTQQHLTWFSKHLETLKSDSRVTVRLYVTRQSTVEVVGDTAEPSSSKQGHSVATIVASDPEKQLFPGDNSPIATSAADWEKGSSARSDQTSSEEQDTGTICSLPVAYERPDVDLLIRSAVNKTATDKSVLVMGCGPDALMAQVRNTAASCIRTGGPGVELHCEQFGW